MRLAAWAALSKALPLVKVWSRAAIQISSLVAEAVLPMPLSVPRQPDHLGCHLPGTFPASISIFFRRKYVANSPLRRTKALGIGTQGGQGQ
jgi:hypothetical protein